MLWVMKSYEELSSKIKQFCEERDWDQFHNPKDLAIGLVTEASELLEIFRFKSPEEIAEILREPKEKTKIEDELADVLFFILRFSERFSIDLLTASEKNWRRTLPSTRLKRAAVQI